MPSRRPNAARGRAIAAALSLVLASPHSVSFITGWEGNVLHTYYDIVGVPTACSGITDPDVAVPGRKFTELECRQLNSAEIEHYAALTASCLPKTYISQREFDAYVSLSYNIGPQAFCASTLVKRLEAGDRYGACDQVLRWDRAGGKQVRGLTNRRVAEHKQCTGAIRVAAWTAEDLLRLIDHTPERLERLRCALNGGGSGCAPRKAQA